jgi:hypothetical protein
LIALDVRNNKELDILQCGNNNLSRLDLTQNTLMIQLYCQDNNLDILNISTLKYISLNNLRCYNNGMTELVVSSSTQSVFKTVPWTAPAYTDIDIGGNSVTYADNQLLKGNKLMDGTTTQDGSYPEGDYTGVRYAP